MKKLVLLFSFLLFIAPATLLADSFEWDFQILPLDGAVSGAPGDTVGWGYEINNLDSDRWLSFDLDILSTDSNQPTFIDYPQLIPGESVSMPTGLCELFLFPDDLITAYQGSIRLTALWYSDAFVTLIDKRNYPPGFLYVDRHYSATETTAVPEPTTLLLLASGLIGCLGWNKRKK